MREDIAKAWIADLRNPEHKQAKDVLFNGEGYCCLGRLCAVMGYGFKRDEGGAYRVLGCNTLLPHKVRDAAEMWSVKGARRDNESKSLAQLNDGGATFSEIADIIEQHWRDL